MYTKPRYSLKNMMLWTREDTLLFLAISAVPVILYELVGLKWLHLPWLPVALIGTAVAYIDAKSNKPTQLLSLQSTQLRELKLRGLIEDFRHMEMQNVLVELYALQGKSERIKNFPYPRQYATLNSIFLWIFIVLVPFGVMFEFDQIGQEFKASYPLVASYFVWMSVPFSAMVMWVFHTMERIGRVSENPFEGNSMDVPITTMSRGIEIDLREMIDDNPASIPAPIEPQYDTQT